jgi:hypothetical protein
VFAETAFLPYDADEGTAPYGGERVRPHGCEERRVGWLVDLWALQACAYAYCAHVARADRYRALDCEACPMENLIGPKLNFVRPAPPGLPNSTKILLFSDSLGSHPVSP